METVILCIKADEFGNKLFIKHYSKMNDRMFCFYRSTYNDMPFQETELFLVDNNKNVAICGDDGTIMWRFSIDLLDKFKGN